MLTFLICKYQRSLKQCKNLNFCFNKKNALAIIRLQELHLGAKSNKECECDENGNKKFELPEEPQNCCMSGCANCVWIDYAEKLAEIFQDDGEMAKQKIMEHVKDPNLRAFIMMELDDLFKEKNKK